jgi:hypothetical protein
MFKFLCKKLHVAFICRWGGGGGGGEMVSCGFRGEFSNPPNWIVL